MIASRKSNFVTRPSTLMTLLALLVQQVCQVTGSFEVGDFADALKSSIAHEICTNQLGYELSDPLARLCRDEPLIFDYASKGFHSGMEECRHAFKNSRWNCSTADGVEHHKLFGTSMVRNSREAAVMLSIASAGMVEFITKELHRGTKPTTEEPSRRCLGAQTRLTDETESFDDALSCEAHVQRAESFARDVIERWEPKQNVNEVLLNGHNSAVGRLAVREHMDVLCRCVGPSGACNAKCCYRTLKPLRSSVAWLKKQYHDAVKVSASLRWKRDGSRSLLTVLSRPPSKTDLIYLLDSPNFCNSDPRLGTVGTEGRLCNATADPETEESCHVICCGRGYVTHRSLRSYQCRCKFKWCCDVLCDTCERLVTEHRCK